MLKSIITKRFSANAAITILCCSMGFHLLVLTGLVPYEIVWGGRLTNEKEMITFETISLSINALMVTVLLISAGYFRVGLKPSLLRFLLWVMTTIFIVNTIGNIFSANSTETMIFTPLTFLLAVFCLRLATD